MGEILSDTYDLTINLQISLSTKLSMLQVLYFRCIGHYSERHVAESVYADVFLGVMIVRGENIALFGESTDSGSIIEAPLDVVLRKVGEMKALAEQQPKGVSVDLGFLDDI